MSSILYGSFDPTTASADDVVAFAKSLRGKSLREIVPASGLVGENRPGDKGAVGQLVERAFRLPRNSEQRPDFEHAGIELKVVPLKRGLRAVRSKERTSVTMIDYAKLAEESWENAKVRKKLQKILFIFYFHLYDGEPLDVVVDEILLWSPNDELLPQMQRDWSVVQRKVLDGLAHKISEGDGRVLGAATKGAGHGRLVNQPRNPAEQARPRVWALKPSLTSWLYEEETSGSKPTVSLRVALKLDKAQDFEPTVIARLDSFRGLSLAEVAQKLEVPISSARSGAALLVRRGFGVLNDKAAIREFKERGIQVKIVPISPDGWPWEAMSFPKFDHMEVWKERWEESDLLQHLNRLLIVPLVRPTRSTPKEEQVWDSAFFWSPSSEQLRKIKGEWLCYIRRIKRGEADRLPKAAETECIHIRPHARDKNDTEMAPLVGPVVKKCFWLNKDFIARIVHDHSGAKSSPS